MKSGNLNFLELSGPLQACNGTALPFIVFNKQYFIEHNSETDVTMIIIIIQFMEKYFTYLKCKGIVVCEGG